MKIAIASDHAGYEEKERLKPLLNELGIQFEDLGTVSEDSVDYPDYARKVGEEVAQGRVDQGLLVCGSGTGMAIAANKVPGVRAAVAWNEETARLAREHNDANVLSLGARVTATEDLPEDRARVVRRKVRRRSARATGEKDPRDRAGRTRASCATLRLSEQVRHAIPTDNSFSGHPRFRPPTRHFSARSVPNRIQAHPQGVWFKR